jgi:hypothetical protein
MMADRAVQLRPDHAAYVSSGIQHVWPASTVRMCLVLLSWPQNHICLKNYLQLVEAGCQHLFQEDYSVAMERFTAALGRLA